MHLFANTAARAIPDDKRGWAVGAGMTLKMPGIRRTPSRVQVAYTEGRHRPMPARA